LFVRRVSLDRLDEVGNEVMTALKFGIDIRPRVVDQLTLIDEPVVRQQ